MKLPINYNRSHWTVRKDARQQYVKEQGGNCYYCKSPLSSKAPQEILDKKITPSLYPEQFFNYPIHLHHCRDTGMTIGAVHNYCNAVLWEHHGE